MANLDKFSMLVIDPFDKTYNPAKIMLKGSDLEQKYIKSM